MLCASMTFMMCGIVSFAASGEMRFSDPSTTVGANVEVTVRLSADYSLGNVSATLSYDSQYLRFVSGDMATDNGGQIQLTGNGSGSSEVNWSLQFQALAEGTTQITIASVSATDADGDSVSVTQGNSTVTIGPGDPSLITDTTQSTSGGGGSIEIDGQSYTVSTEIPDVLIPEGFVKADMTYNGQTYAATKQETGSVYAVYLANAEGEEDFFLYDPDTDAFSQFEQISISDSRYIVLLDESGSEALPSNLQETTMTVNGKTFPAWQNVDASAYYVVYALNSDGEKGYYQYDTLDGTYQRYTPETVDDTEEDDTKAGILNKLRDNLDKVILVVWGIFLLMLLVMIILAIKLRHRNLELDDLYDEYGIDEEEEEAVETKADKKARKKAEKEAKKNKKSKKSEDDLYDFEDEDDEYDYEDEESEDEYDYEDEDDYEEEPFKDYEPSDYEDDSEIDDLDELLNARVRVKKPMKRPKVATVGPEQPRRVGHSEIDDTFKMDLIDLD